MVSRFCSWIHPRTRVLAPFLASFVVAFQSGCSGSVSSAKGPEGDQKKRDTRVVHEPCDITSGSAEKFDANGDGKPDVWVVKKDNCQAVDLNFDGKVDSYTYFDSSGQVRRRERDYDRDGRIEEITIYEGGTIKEKYRSTTLADRLDTWQHYEGGRLARVERDSDGDAVVDQWWEFSAGNEKCPLIHSDVDGDGKPDPGATIDYCKQTGYVPPSRSGPKGPKHTFERPGLLPEEVENKEAPGGAPPTSAPSGDKSKAAPKTAPPPKEAPKPAPKEAPKPAPKGETK